VILSCASGRRSLAAAEQLAEAGYAAPINLTGGFSGRRNPIGALLEPGWVDAGLPVEQEAPGRTWAELRR
jgi:rhodanese-related sulfurtransferase